MYYVEDYFPFLEKAKTIKTVTKTINTMDIFYQGYPSKGDVQVKNKVYQGILIQPNGYVVLNELPEVVCSIKNKFTYLTVELKEVDYGKVARCVKTGNRQDGLLCAYYPEVVGFSEQVIKTDDFISYVSDKGVSFFNTNPELGKVSEGSVVIDEALDVNKVSVKPNDVKAVSLQNEDAPYIEILRSYLSNPLQTNQVPLLLGKTAVAKSAIIKNLCDEYDAKCGGKAPDYGMRIVDIRSSFMERTDIEGLCKKIEYKKGTTKRAKEGDDISIFSASAPMARLVECTDGYINYCRDAVKVLQKKLTALTGKAELTESVVNDDACLNMLWNKYVRGSDVILNEARGIDMSAVFSSYGLPVDFDREIANDEDVIEIRESADRFSGYGINAKESVMLARYVVLAKHYDVEMPTQDAIHMLQGIKKDSSLITEAVAKGTSTRKKSAVDKPVDNAVTTGTVTTKGNRKVVDDVSNTEKIMQLRSALDNFLIGAKIPVLFFDEITRCSKSVMQCLTKILNDKNFMGYDMKIARVVSATNTNKSKASVGDDDDNSSPLYQTTSMSDQAVYDRFSSMLIQPSDVFDSWKQWGKAIKNGKTNIHELVMKYVVNPENPSDTRIVYDQKDIDNITNNFKYINDDGQEMELDGDDDAKEASATSFPNYRTWEMISDILYAKESTKTVLLSQIRGLLGNRVGILFGEYLSTNGWKVLNEQSDESDPMLDMVNECMENGTPTMLIGPSSVGKTSRVKQAVKRYQAEFIEINLAECEKGDLMGLNTMVKTTNFISSNFNALDKESQDELTAIADKYGESVDGGIPSDVTIRAPRKNIADRFVKALEADRKVVLFFDEVNRVQNPAVMSALFEAVSDHRIFGYDFSAQKENVRVICACNLGDNMRQAQRLDPAFSARFSIYRKRGYDKKDVENFIKYAEGFGDKEKAFSPELLTFLKEHKDDGIVLNMLKSVDERSLEMSSASSRAIEDMDKLIKSCKGNSVFTGKILAPDDTKEGTARSAFMADSDFDADLLLSTIDRKIDSWSARLCNECDRGEVEKTVKTYKEWRANGLDASDIKGASANADIINFLKGLFRIDSAIIRKRKQMIEYRLGSGDGAQAFATMYNVLSGDIVENVKIQETVDESKIPAYIECAFRNKSALNDHDKIIRSKGDLKCILDEVYEFVGDDFNRINLRKLFFGGDTVSTFGSGGVMSYISDSGVRSSIIKTLCQSNNGVEVLLALEKKEAEYILKIAEYCGLEATLGDIKKFLSNSGATKVAYFR